MSVKLTPRLQKIAELVPQGHKIADIGTDHGYVPIYLLTDHRIPSAIAADINSKPLESAKTNIQLHHLTEKIETRLGNGLEVLAPKEVDTVIVTGMGGILISEILESSKELAKTFQSLILQPMQASSDLRKYLVDHGYKIKKDVLVKEEDKIYEVILAAPGSQSVKDPIQYEIGFHLKENPRELAEEFIRKKLKVTEEVIKNIKQNASNNSLVKLNEYEKRKEKLGEVLVWLNK